MNVRIVTVGRAKPAGVQDLCDEFLRRIRRWSSVTWQALPETGYRPGQEAMALAREGDRILGAIGGDAFVVVLTPKGELIDSPELARRIAVWRERAKEMVFVVGGSLGVDERVIRRADWQWSLSPLTFPHALAQLLLAEQIYRGLSILAHHPYHK